MNRVHRPHARAFAPRIEAALETRELMSARVVTAPHPPALLAPMPAKVVAASTAAPEVARAELVVRGKTVTGIALTFTQPMKPSAVSNIRNYFLYDAGSRASRPRNSPIPLKSASYKPRTATVILVPARPLDPAGTYLLTNVDVTNPLRTRADIQRASARLVGFKSVAGVPLNGLGTGTGSFGELVTRRSIPAGAG